MAGAAIGSGCTRALALAVVLAAGLAPAAPAAQRSIVMKASGPSARRFPPGAVLPDQAAITLLAGDELELLDGGGTRTLTGPAKLRGLGARTLATQDAAAMATWVLAARQGRSVAAGTRAMPDEPAAIDPPPSLWLIDATRSGSWCLNDGDPVILWRKDASRAAMLSITRDGDRAASIPWPAGAATLALPGAPPTASLSRLAVQLDRGASAALVIHLIAPADDDLLRLGKALYSNGCYIQLGAIGD